MRFFSSLLLSVFLAGCAGVGVVATSDPAQKLKDAYYLFRHEDRPLIAERLIREAMAIYEEKGDMQGLGDADKAYGDLLLSPAISGKWQTVYKREGFQDRTVTYENRDQKALEYFSKAVDDYSRAADQLRDTNDYQLVNVYYKMSYSYFRLGNRAKACQMQDETLSAYDEYARRNPNSKVPLPQGSLADVVARTKKSYGCP